MRVKMMTLAGAVQCIFYLIMSALICQLIESVSTFEMSQVGRGFLVCRWLWPWTNALRLRIRVPSAQLFSGNYPFSYYIHYRLNEFLVIINYFSANQLFMFKQWIPLCSIPIESNIFKWNIRFDRYLMMIWLEFFRVIYWVKVGLIFCTRKTLPKSKSSFHPLIWVLARDWSMLKVRTNIFPL